MGDRMHVVMVAAEGVGHRTDLPRLAEIEAMNLGVLLDGDHRPAPATHDGCARAMERAKRLPGRRISIARAHRDRGRRRSGRRFPGQVASGAAWLEARSLTRALYARWDRDDPGGLLDSARGADALPGTRAREEHSKFRIGS